MPSHTTDFASPINKTVGCYVALSMLPIVLAVHVISQNPLPTTAFILSAGIFLTGHGALIGRPRSVDQVIRVTCAILCRWKR